MCLVEIPRTSSWWVTDSNCQILFITKSFPSATTGCVVILEMAITHLPEFSANSTLPYARRSDLQLFSYPRHGDNDMYMMIHCRMIKLKLLSSNRNAWRCLTHSIWITTKLVYSASAIESSRRHSDSTSHGRCSKTLKRTQRSASAFYLDHGIVLTSFSDGQT